MTHSLKTHLAAYTAGMLFVLVAGLFLYSQSTHASAPPGLAATIYNASTTAQVVSSTQGVIAATSSNCAARIISTATTSLMLTFTDYNSAGVVPTSNNGVWQAASTTVAYDSGQYGCGAVRGMANGSGVATVITTF